LRKDVVSTKAPDILGQVATIILDSHFRPRAGQRVLVLAGEDKLDLGERLRKGRGASVAASF